MLGWHVTVYRLQDGAEHPPTFDSPTGDWIAEWQTGLNGLDWLDELVAADRALLLGGNGYPLRYAGQAQRLLRSIIKGPPGAYRVWVRGADDIITHDYRGRTVVNGDAAKLCAPQDWLVVSAWDQS